MDQSEIESQLRKIIRNALCEALREMNSNKGRDTLVTHHAAHSHIAHHHAATHTPGLGVFHMFEHLVMMVHHGLPHVEIRLPTRLLLGIADGCDIGLHLVKSRMHFLYIRLHAINVFLAHRLHLRAALCALAGRSSWSRRLGSCLRSA